MTATTKPTRFAINPNQFKTESPAGVTLVGNAATDLFTIDTAGTNKLFVQVASSGTSAALTAFVISAQATPDAPFVTIFSAAGDFTSPKGPMVGASGSLVTLAGGASGWFIMDVSCFAGIKVTVTSASTPTITAHIGGI